MSLKLSSDQVDRLPPHPLTNPFGPHSRQATNHRIDNVHCIDPPPWLTVLAGSRDPGKIAGEAPWKPTLVGHAQDRVASGAKLSERRK
jgi:hypothetical protein